MSDEDQSINNSEAESSREADELDVDPKQITSTPQKQSKKRKGRKKIPCSWTGVIDL